MPHTYRAWLPLAASLALLLGADNLNAQSSTGKDSNQPGMKVGHVDHAESMEELLQAAQALREAVQQMAKQDSGPKREAAMDAAKNALLLTQKAMLELPAELRVEGTTTREAKDWPRAMARLDKAAQSLSESVEAISNSKQVNGKANIQAMTTAKSALKEVQDAMLAVPKYKVAN